MKTLIAVLVAAAVASPALAQENDRTGNPNQIGAQVTRPAPDLTQNPSVSNAYARVGRVPAANNAATTNVDPDPFIRSQLPRDAYSD
jgi:hypothetical protein